MQTLSNKNRGLNKLLFNKSEKINIQTGIKETQAEKISTPVSLIERGNNNAKRKEFFDLETVIEEVFPTEPDFDREKARIVSYTDFIRYKYIPPKFIKQIYRQYNCLFNEKVYSGKAPRAPLQNSNYDSSFIAGMLQLRYIQIYRMVSRRRLPKKAFLWEIGGRLVVDELDYF